MVATQSAFSSFCHLCLVKLNGNDLTQAMASLSASLSSKTHKPQTDAHGAIRVWLFALTALIFVMVLVGGATRLTDSGLSITEWKPIIGIIPPLTDTDWQDAFQKYKQIPEYKLVNKGMNLSEFKTIFWWEWGHRFLGRMIGFAFLLPFLFFWLTRRIEQALFPKLTLMFVLGGLQGLLGWYMVKSGLVDRVDVSQYRLAAHLGLAVLIFSYIFWVALGLEDGEAGSEASPSLARERNPSHSVHSRHSVHFTEKQQYERYGSGYIPDPAVDGSSGEFQQQPLSPGGVCNPAHTVHSGYLIFFAVGLCVLVFLQIIFGAFVAGLKAGLSHNTWPLMDGKFIPDGLFAMTPWYVNFFENVLTVQFNHRILAYGIAVFACLNLALVGRHIGEGKHMLRAALIVVMVLIQVGLGIWTLLAHVPLGLGLAHQAGALILLVFTIYQLHGLVSKGYKGLSL